MANGQAVCWGVNSDGRCNVPEANATWRSISVSIDNDAHSISCGITTDGIAHFWGAQHVAYPEEFRRGGLRWQVMDCSLYGACGITIEGELLCWGKPAAPPEVTEAIAHDNATWTSVSCYGEGGCALRSSGIAYCWGKAWSPRLRILQNDESPLIDAVITRSMYCAAAANGKVFCYNDNAGGAHALVPVPEVAGGWRKLAPPCGVSNEGKVYCWGEGTSGNIPQPAAGFVTVHGLPENGMCGVTAEGTAVCWGQRLLDEGFFEPPAEYMGESFIEVDVDVYSMGAITQDGTAVFWGSTEAQLLKNAAPLGFQWRSISIASSTACGISVSGELHCWGLCLRSLCSQPRDLAPWRSISCDGARCCGLTEAHNLHCWGEFPLPEGTQQHLWVEVATESEAGICALEKDTQRGYCYDKLGVPLDYPPLEDQWKHIAPPTGRRLCGITSANDAKCYEASGTVSLIVPGPWAALARNSDEMLCLIDVNGTAVCFEMDGPRRLHEVTMKNYSTTPLAPARNVP